MSRGVVGARAAQAHDLACLSPLSDGLTSTVGSGQPVDRSLKHDGDSDGPRVLRVNSVAQSYATWGLPRWRVSRLVLTNAHGCGSYGSKVPVKVEVFCSTSVDCVGRRRAFVSNTCLVSEVERDGRQRGPGAHCAPA